MRVKLCIAWAAVCLGRHTQSVVLGPQRRRQPCGGREGCSSFAATAVMGRRAGSGSSGDGDDDWGTRTNGVYCEQSTGEVMRGEAVTGRWVAGAAWRVSVTVVGRGSEEGALELRVRSR